MNTAARIAWRTVEREAERANPGRLAWLTRDAPVHGIDAFAAYGVLAGSVSSAKPPADEASTGEMSGRDGLSVHTGVPWARQVLNRAAAAEIVRQDGLALLFDALRDAGVPHLLMKGTSLAYSLYPAPFLRPRADHDVLIRRADLARATEVLESLGYVAAPVAGRRLASYQQTFSGPAGRAPIDLHWKVSNRQRAGALFPWHELVARSVALPELGADVYALGPGDQFLISAFHRLVHDGAPIVSAGHRVRGSARLVWKVDLFLLWASLDVSGQLAIAERAFLLGFGPVCTDALDMLEADFAVPIPVEIRRALDAADAAPQVSLEYFRATGARGAVHELAALDSWRSRLELIGEWLCPPAAYMRARYDVRRPLAVAGAYAWRMCLGLREALARPATSEPTFEFLPLVGLKAGKPE